MGRHFPQAPRPWIDLSTGINPWPYVPGNISDESWRTLPASSLSNRCRDAVAAYLGSDASGVALMPGSQAALSLLPRLFPAGSVAIVEPTYAEHRAMWQLAGHDVRARARIEESQDEAVLLVVNPNNPDGRVWPAETLRQLAEQRARRDQWLIVDEAFADPSPQTGIAAAALANTVVLRSFGKFFGLAGMRLGVAVASPDVVRRMEDMIGPWAVSGPALEVAARAYADHRWQAATRERLAQETRRLRRLLEGHGLRVVGGTDLFTLVEHAHADRLFSLLCRHGIYVRRFPYEARWLRLGLLPDEAALDRLQRVLATWAHTYGESR